MAQKTTCSVCFLSLLILILAFSFEGCADNYNSAKNASPASGIKQSSVEKASFSLFSSDDANPGENLADKTVDEILAQTSLREKIGQLFSIRANGRPQSNDSQMYPKLTRQ